MIITKKEKKTHNEKIYIKKKPLDVNLIFFKRN